MQKNPMVPSFLGLGTGTPVTSLNLRVQFAGVWLAGLVTRYILVNCVISVFDF